MKTFAITDMGQKRNTNQDYVFASDAPVGNLPNLFIVADGMGGHNAGDLASKFTVETVVEAIKADPGQDTLRIMEQAIQSANEQLLAKAKESEELKGMGTTIVISTIVGHKLYAGNVGDSRLYIIREEMEQITNDHSLVEEMVRIGELDREEAKKHPDKNIITRAIGANAKVEVDFFDATLMQGDIILMCTDGLTNMVDDEDIMQVAISQRDIQEKAETLISQANSNGGKDNIGIIMIEPFTGEVSL